MKSEVEIPLVTRTATLECKLDDIVSLSQLIIRNIVKLSRVETSFYDKESDTWWTRRRPIDLLS